VGIVGAGVAGCERGGVVKLVDEADEDRVIKDRLRAEGVGGDPRVHVGGVVSPLMLSLSSDRVGLLSGAGLMILSPTTLSTPRFGL